MWRLASVIAASKRMIGNCRATCEDGLDDRLAHLRLQVVELRGVVPRHGGAVVAVVDVARLAAPVIARA